MSSLNLHNCPIGSAVGPDLVGIVGRNGRSDQQAFLIGYFDVAGDLHSRQARSARRVMDEDLSHMDDPYVVYGRNGMVRCMPSVCGFGRLWAGQLHKTGCGISVILT